MQSEQARWRAFSGILFPLAAGVATVATFYLVKLSAAPGTYVYSLFFERSWIQYVSVLCFWLTVSVLVAQHIGSYRELASLALARQIVESPDFDTALIWSDADRVRDRFRDETHRRHHASIAFVRISNALDRLRKSQSTSAVEEYFKGCSDRDAGKLETSYAGIRYFVWLLPTVGLIGTVLGLGRGMSKFGNVIEHADNFAEIKRALPEVTNNLGTAFDATFLAIFLSAVAAFYMSFLQKRQEHILEEVDNLCSDQVCAMFQEHSTSSAEIIRALKEQMEQLVRSSNGNRAQLERSIERLGEVLVEGAAAAQQQRQMSELVREVAALREVAGRMLGAGIPVPRG